MSGRGRGRCDKTDVERTFYHGDKIPDIPRPARNPGSNGSDSTFLGCSINRMSRFMAVPSGKLPEVVSPLRVEEEGSGWQVTRAKRREWLSTGR